MGKRTEEWGENTDIEYDTLADGSVAHNVLFRTAGPKLEERTQRSCGSVLRFACGTEQQAMALADALETNVCWAEVA